MLSTSPVSIFSWFNDDHQRNNGKLTLDGFLRELPVVIDATVASKGNLAPRDGEADPVADLFG
jgi:hypothetical protein